MTDPLTGWRILGGMSDPVNHPQHYAHPSGVEAIDICEHLTFNLGNALKYLWRVGKKGPAAEDYRKAAWYLRREASRTAWDGITVGRDVQTLARKALSADDRDRMASRHILAFLSHGWVPREVLNEQAKICDLMAAAVEAA